MTHLAISYEPLQVHHLTALGEVLMSPDVYEHIGGHVPSLQEFRLSLERAIAGPPIERSDEHWLNYLIRTESGAMLGRLEATIHHGIAEVAFLLSPNYWGKGIATEALTWLHNEIYRVSGVREIWATTVNENARSQQLLARCGYQKSETPIHPLFSYDEGDLVFRCITNT